MTDIARIGEIHSTMRIDGQIVGTVEAFSLPALGQDSHRAVFFSDGDAPIATGIGPLGRNEPALRIKIQAIGPAARLAIDHRLARRRAIAHDAVADVAEIDAKPRPTR